MQRILQSAMQSYFDLNGRPRGIEPSLIPTRKQCFFVASIIFFGGWLIQVPGNIVIGVQLRLLWLFFRQSGGRLPVAPCAADVEVPLPGHYLGHIGQNSGKTRAKLGQNSQMCGFLQWALAESRKGECPLFWGNACQTGLASSQHIVYSSHSVHCTGLR